MTRFMVAAIVLLGVAGGGLDAAAQSRGRSREAAPRVSSGSDDTLPPNVPPRVSTLSPTRGISGPRLEPGAVLCGSEEALQNRALVSRRISDGVPDPGDPISGCRLIGQERGVEVVARHGLGRAQVKLKPTGELGWTDAYLP